MNSRFGTNGGRKETCIQMRPIKHKLMHVELNVENNILKQVGRESTLLRT